MPLSLQGPAGPGFEVWLAALAVDAALKGTLILLIAWAAMAALRRSSATVRHFVWCLAFLGLAVLPVLSLTLPAWQVPGLKEAVSQIALPAVESPIATAAGDDQASLQERSRKSAVGTSTRRALELAKASATQSGSLDRAQVTVSDSGDSGARTAHTSWSERISRLWVLGTIAALLPLFAGLVGQYWLTRRVRRLSDRAWMEPLEELRSYFRIWRPITLCVSPRSVGPLTLGVFQPVVLIPADARDWNLERRRVVILHELAHIRRYDVLTQICAQVVCAMYWFHPLVWIAARRMRFERETACDDLVLTAGVRASTYAQHLLEIASVSRKSGLPAAAVAGMPCGSRLESRVTTILDSCRDRRPLTFTAIVCVIAIAAFAVTAVASAGVGSTSTSTSDKPKPGANLIQAATFAQRAASQAAVSVVPGDTPPVNRLLPGFLPTPGNRPGVERWQMITATPRGSIWAVAWSPDGKHVAFGEGGNVRIYAADTLEPVRILIGHTGRVTSIRWSRDGRRVVSSSLDGTVRLWNEDGSPGPVLNSAAPVRCATWSPDGRHIAGAGSDGLVYLWRADAGQLEKTFQGHEAPVNAVAWSPDGRHIASGCDNRTVRVWSADGTPGPVMEGHSGPVLSISWSPDGKQLASADFGFDAGDGQEEHSSSVRLWSVDGRAGSAFVGRNTGQTYSVAWSPDGRWVAAAGWDGRVRVWSTDGQTSKVLDGSSFCIYSIAWSPDSTRLISGCQQLNSRFPAKLLTWHLNATATRTLQAGGNGIFCVAWSPDGRQFAAACRDGKTRVWDASGKLQQTLAAGDYDIYGVAWSPDGQKLASVCRDSHTLKVWSTDSWKELDSFTHSNTLRALDWNPDSSRIAMASDANQAVVFDLATKKATEYSDRHRHGVTCVDWNPSGTQFASCSFDSTVRLWNTNGTVSAVLEDFSVPTRAVAWSPDGKQLVTGREDNALRLWDADGTPGAILSGHEGYVQSVAWSPDGKRIASGSWDNTIRLWTPDGTPESVFKGHGASVFSVAWNGDSRRLLSASFDGTIRLWNADSGQTEYSVVLREDGATATLSASGELLSGDASVIDSEFIYLVEAPNGAFEILKPTEFQMQTSEVK